MIFRAAHWKENIATGRLALDLSDRLYRVEPGDDGQPEVTPQAIVTLAFDSKLEAEHAALTQELTERKGRAPIKSEPFWLVSDDQSADETLRSATPSELAVFEQAWNRRRADQLAGITPEELERENRIAEDLADRAERSRRREVEAWQESERVRQLPGRVRRKIEVLNIWCEACRRRVATVYRVHGELLLASNRLGDPPSATRLQSQVHRNTIWLADQRLSYVLSISCTCDPGRAERFSVRSVLDRIRPGCSSVRACQLAADG